MAALGARAAAERVRRIGVLMPYAADNREGQTRMVAFRQGLAELGWSDGGNVRIDARWASGDPDRYRQYAAELVALAPDVIVAVTSGAVAALQRETRTVPIVFRGRHRPCRYRFVANLARPGGNTTGFTVFEYGLSRKMAGTAQGDRAAHEREQRSFVIPTWSPESACSAELNPWRRRSSGVAARSIRTTFGEMERAVAAFAHEPNGGPIVSSSAVGLPASRV